MGSQYPEYHRSDEQLEVILFETAAWTINGHNGQVFCTVPSLRLALDRATAFAASGAVVVALCRKPGNNIIVFDAQIRRLRKLCTGHATERPFCSSDFIDSASLLSASPQMDWAWGNAQSL